MGIKRFNHQQLRRPYFDDMWEEMGWDEKSWDEVRWGEKSWDEVRWGEKSSHDLRWDEVRRAHMIWDEMKCLVCDVRRVQGEAWDKVFAWRCIAPGSRAGHVLGQQHCNRFAQSTRLRAWLAHSACKFYRWERSYSISLRQLPPRLVRVLLVTEIYYVYYISALSRVITYDQGNLLDSRNPWDDACEPVSSLMRVTKMCPLI